MTIPQSEVEAKGEEIFAIVDGRKVLPDAINPAVWYGRLMEWSMGNEQLKVQTLRFVDVLPALNSSGSVVEHMQEYFKGNEVGLAAPLRFGLNMSRLTPWLVGPTVKKSVGSMARQFITGRTGAEAVPVLKKIRGRGVGFTVDILGEAVVSEKEAEEYYHRYLELIESLAKEAKHWPDSDQLEGGTNGGRPIPKVNVSVKISALYSQIHPADPENAILHLKERLRPLFRRAKELGVFINLDMENYGLKNLTISLFESLLDEPEFQEFHDAGLVIQAYLRDSPQDIERLIAWAKERNRRITIRLVKGAYWDYETVMARQRGWPIPVYLKKPQSDANYERLAKRMLEAHEQIYSAFGSHNVRSIAYLVATAEGLGLNRHAYEIQMLYGMAEPIKQALVQLGHRVREYCPVGEMLPGMAYLVRRLLENTSNEGFLKAKFTTQVASKELLRNPLDLVSLDEPEPASVKLDIPADSEALLPPALGEQVEAALDGMNGTSGSAPKSSDQAMRKPFANEPPADFTLEDTRQQMRAALAEERAAFGKDWPLVIGGKPVTGNQWIDSVNPAKPSEKIGRVVAATKAQAQAAVDAAVAAAPGWRAMSADQRADILDRMAALMREERFKLDALEVYEVGKAWAEADGDLAEAIDFCDFYAAEMRQLGRPQATFSVPGENSTQEYIPRGVGLVIAPWNFPLAILCGMTVAALVTGNTVVMKPAEQSSIVAARFMDLATRAGLPPGVLNLLTGHGEEVGEFLVNHPKIDFIAFTGSKEVGLKIWEAGGKTRPGQSQLKKVVCEMGGKNALIIDADADPGRGGHRRAVLGLRLPGAEVLGPVAAHRSSGLLRPLRGASGRGHFQPQGRLPGRTRDHRRARGGPGGARAHQTLRGNRQGRGAASLRGQGPGGRRLLHRADDLRRGFAGRPHRQGRNLRSGPGRVEGKGPGRSHPLRQRHGVCPDRRPLLTQPGQHRQGETRVGRGQPLHQPHDHRGRRGASSVRRVQDVRRRHQGRGTRLPAKLRIPPRRDGECPAARLRSHRGRPGRAGLDRGEVAGRYLSGFRPEREHKEGVLNRSGRLCFD